MKELQYFKAPSSRIRDCREVKLAVLNSFVFTIVSLPAVSLVRAGTSAFHTHLALLLYNESTAYPAALEPNSSSVRSGRSVIHPLSTAPP